MNLNLKTTKLFFLPEGVVCSSCIINTKLIGSKSWYKDLPSKVYFCLVRISTRTFRGHHNRDRQPISTTLLSKANSFLFDSHSTQQDVHAPGLSLFTDTFHFQLNWTGQIFGPDKSLACLLLISYSYFRIDKQKKPLMCLRSTTGQISNCK